MSISELVELILKENNYDYEQTASDINELYLSLKLCPYQLLGELEELCLKNGRCPECGALLECESSSELREYNGRLVVETITSRKCTKCDYGGDE